jgi:STE24 endopeptidase
MYRRILLLSLTLLLTVNLPLPGKAEVAASPTPPPAAVIQGGNIKAFDPAAATKAWLDTVPADKRARSDRYFEGGYWLILWDFLYGGAVLLILLESGWSARLRDIAERVTRRKPAVNWIYWAGFSVASFVLGLPLAVYEGFIREKQYGLMNQTFLSWFVDQLKNLGLSVVFGGLFVMAVFGIIRRLPRTWHVWGP